jgi:hypothetical protein
MGMTEASGTIDLSQEQDSSSDIPGLEEEVEEEEEEATSDDSIVSLEKRDMPDLPSTLLPMERTKHDEICAEGGAEGGAEGVRIVE